jgi:hypothetical protein
VVPVVDEVLRAGTRDSYRAQARVQASKSIEGKVVRAIETIIGKIARRKIMRRMLSSIPNAMDIGDVTTLANPSRFVA